MKTNVTKKLLESLEEGKRYWCWEQGASDPALRTFHGVEEPLENEYEESDCLPIECSFIHPTPVEVPERPEPVLEREDGIYLARWKAVSPGAVLSIKNGLVGWFLEDTDEKVPPPYKGHDPNNWHWIADEPLKWPEEEQES